MDIKIPFGIRAGKLIHISELNETERGMKCGCVCPSCKMNLSARLGKKNKHHFAHHNDNCKNALETALHLFAKETLEKYKRIKLPRIRVNNYIYYKNINDFSKGITELNFEAYNLDYMDEEEYEKVTLVREQNLKFERVEVEKRIGNIIPDIVVYYKDVPLIVEIGVTHFIDDEKEKRIKNIGISTIEIDLRNIDYLNFNRNEIENIVIESLDNKNWIFNRQAENKKKEIIEKNKLALEKLEAEHELERKKRAELTERLKREKDEKKKRILMIMDNYQDKLKEYEQNFSYDRLLLDFAERNNMDVHNIPDFLNINVDGEFTFACNRRTWQSSIFEKFILNRKNKSIMVGNVVRWVTKYSVLKFNKEFAFTKDLDFNVINLTDTIYNYLSKLTKYGFLEISEYKARFYSNFWIVHDELNIPKKRHIKIESSINKRTNSNVLTRAVPEYYITPCDENEYVKTVNNRAKRVQCLDKIGKCNVCGKMTSDWVTFDGSNNTCLCRSCRYSDTV